MLNLRPHPSSVQKPPKTLHLTWKHNRSPVSDHPPPPLPFSLSLLPPLTPSTPATPTPTPASGPLQSLFPLPPLFWTVGPSPPPAHLSPSPGFSRLCELKSLANAVPHFPRPFSPHHSPPTLKHPACFVCTVLSPLSQRAGGCVCFRWCVPRSKLGSWLTVRANEASAE